MGSADIGRPPTPLTQQLGRVVVVVLVGLSAAFAVGAMFGVLVTWQVRRGRRSRHDREGGA